MKYPKTTRLDLVETLHGVPVADPYRWLEDDAAQDTRAWVGAQNAFTRSVLDAESPAPTRSAVVQRLSAAYDHPRTTSFVARGGREFFTLNPGLLNALIVEVRADRAEPRVLIDPNTLTPDGTTALTAYFPSEDGRFVAYALSVHGSDRQVIKVLEVRERAELADTLQSVKFASVAWTADATGFYYLRFPEPGSVAPEDEQYFGRIYFHRLGDPQSADALVFERPDQKDVVPLVDVSHSGRWVAITAQRGASDDSEVYVAVESSLTPRETSWKPKAENWKPLFTGFQSAYHFVGETNGRLLFRTTTAPMGRIISIDPGTPRTRARVRWWPESSDRLSLAAIARRRSCCPICTTPAR
jgi:prolyl oligopeptidase